MRTPIRDHREGVRGAGRALGLDEEVTAPGLRRHAPGRLDLGAVAAEACSNLGDRFVGVEHHESHHAALDGDGHDGLRVVRDLSESWIGDLRFHCSRRRCMQRDPEQRQRESAHGFAPGAAVLISGSERYATTTKPNGFSSRSFSFASTFGWY
jgi:hypothetical protein